MRSQDRRYTVNTACYGILKDKENFAASQDFMFNKLTFLLLAHN